VYNGDALDDAVGQWYLELVGALYDGTVPDTLSRVSRCGRAAGQQVNSCC
jgi:hypothetical protein